jgi:hypothetical protein
MKTLAIVGLALFVGREAFAQRGSGTLPGVVTRDTLAHTVSGAAIALPQLGRLVRTDSAGSFRFADVPPGRHAIVVRAVGFRVLSDSIDIQGGQTLDADLTLTPLVVLLDTIRTRAGRLPGVPWMLQEFESRRRSSPTGKFLTDSTLRKHDDAVMASVVGMLPGARTVQDRSYVYLASTRASSI